MTAIGSWAALIGLGLTAAAADAAPFTPEVDFRSGAFAAGHGLAAWSAVADLHSFTLEALSGSGGTPVPEGALFWDPEDGFGIESVSYEHDEIEGDEWLRLHFAEPVFLERLLISDLFIEAVTEIGSYSPDAGATWISFSADGLTSNGEIAVDVHAEVQTLLFAAAGRVGSGNHDFSLAGFDANRILEPSGIPHTPEPRSGLLVAAGLLALARRRRR